MAAPVINAFHPPAVPCSECVFSSRPRFGESFDIVGLTTCLDTLSRGEAAQAWWDPFMLMEEITKKSPEYKGNICKIVCIFVGVVPNKCEFRRRFFFFGVFGVSSFSFIPRKGVFFTESKGKFRVPQKDLCFLLVKFPNHRSISDEFFFFWVS